MQIFNVHMPFYSLFQDMKYSQKRLSLLSELVFYLPLTHGHLTDQPLHSSIIFMKNVLYSIVIVQCCALLCNQLYYGSFELATLCIFLAISINNYILYASPVSSMRLLTGIFLAGPFFEAHAFVTPNSG